MALTALMRGRISRYVAALYKEEEPKGTLPTLSIAVQDQMAQWADAAVAQHCTAKQAAWHAIQMLRWSSRSIHQRALD